MTQCQVTQGSKSFFAKMTTEYSPINTWKTCKFSKLEMQFLWMSHEINLMALNITFRRWVCLISNECVPCQQQIGTSMDFAYSEYWWFVAEGPASITHATLHLKAGGFLMPLLCVGPSVQNCHRHVEILDSLTSQCAQNCFYWF